MKLRFQNMKEVSAVLKKDTFSKGNLAWYSEHQHSTQMTICYMPRTGKGKRLADMHCNVNFEQGSINFEVIVPKHLTEDAMQEYTNFVSCVSVLLLEPEECSGPEQDQSNEIREVSEILLKLQAIPLADMGLPIRAFTALRYAGVKTAADIERYREDDFYELLRIRNVGQKSYYDIIHALDEVVRGCRK